VGREGEQNVTFEQRIAEISFDIDADQNGVHLSNWGEHRIILEPDGKYYQTMSQARGPIIYSFRDPQFFKDPNTGKRHLLFEGNSGGDNPTVEPENVGDEEFRRTHIVPEGAEHYNGNIGIAELKDNDFTHPLLLPPLIKADGVNQQLERPHFVVRGSTYYLFTISHEFTYAPGLTGPDGLYGFVGGSLRSDYKPLNGNGLVLANPPGNPLQAYSWYVLKDCSVLSFINEVRTSSGEIREGGTFAPTLRLSLDGDRTKVDGQLEYGEIP
jgi:levansucrase